MLSMQPVLFQSNYFLMSHLSKSHSDRDWYCSKMSECAFLWPMVKAKSQILLNTQCIWGNRSPTVALTDEISLLLKTNSKLRLQTMNESYSSRFCLVNGVITSLHGLIDIDKEVYWSERSTLTVMREAEATVNVMLTSPLLVKEILDNNTVQ